MTNWDEKDVKRALETGELEPDSLVEIEISWGGEVKTYPIAAGDLLGGEATELAVAKRREREKLTDQMVCEPHDGANGPFWTAYLERTAPEEPFVVVSIEAGGASTAAHLIERPAGAPAIGSKWKRVRNWYPPSWGRDLYKWVPA